MKYDATSVPLLQDEGVAKGGESARYESDEPAHGSWSFARILLALITTILASLILVAVCIWYGGHGSSKNGGALRFTSEGTFQLSIFEDLHFGESINHQSRGRLI
jgi:hypothetical protein